MIYTGLKLTWHAAEYGKPERISINQAEYIRSIPMLKMNRRNENDPLTETEVTEIRGGLAKLGWVARNTRPDLAVRVQKGLQEIPRATETQ